MTLNRIEDGYIERKKKSIVTSQDIRFVCVRVCIYMELCYDINK